MPVGTNYVVGASGNDNTCTAQGFLFDLAYIAFPFYYASFSVLALVSVKNNFKEEKYAWMEKWIHLGAYVPPLIIVIYATVVGWMRPGAYICSFRYYLFKERSIEHQIWHVSSFNWPISNILMSHSHLDLFSEMQIALLGVQLAELLVATVTISYLWINFTKIQSSIDAAIGMKRIKEEARQQRTRDVATQSALYLFSFWFMYLGHIVALMIYYFSDNDHVPYDAQIVANVITGSQGIVLLGVYYGVKQQGYDKLPIRVHAHDHKNETVSRIRANAGRRRSRLSILSVTSFRIFDGTPAEDSPWAAYLEDDIESFDDSEINTQFSSGAEENSDLTEGLLRLPTFE